MSASIFGGSGARLTATSRGAPVHFGANARRVAGAYTAFGNNGTTTYRRSVNASSNTALGDLANRSAVLSALTTATDHLPIVADYTVVAPLAGDFNEDGAVDAADFAVWETGFEMESGASHGQGDASLRRPRRLVMINKRIATICTQRRTPCPAFVSISTRAENATHVNQERANQ